MNTKTVIIAILVGVAANWLASFLFYRWQEKHEKQKADGQPQQQLPTVNVIMRQPHLRGWHRRHQQH